MRRVRTGAKHEELLAEARRLLVEGRGFVQLATVDGSARDAFVVAVGVPRAEVEERLARGRDNPPEQN